MSYLTQKTVKHSISFSGIALHSGHSVNVCIKPAKPDFGIVFQRVDLKSNNIVYPNFNNVTNTSLNTTVENEFGVKLVGVQEESSEISQREDVEVLHSGLQDD